MKQTTFDTSQRAEELLRNAMEIWKQTEHTEYLEDLDKDPVFRLLMNAIAYQANELDSTIEQIKADVIGEFQKILSLDVVDNTLAATVPVMIQPFDNVESVIVDGSTCCHLGDTKYGMMPLLKTRSLNAQVTSVNRLDDRRWSIRLSMGLPLHDFGGWSFIISDSYFHDLDMFIVDEEGNRKMLSLVRPEEYSELPLADEFSLDTLLYNRSQSQTVGLGRHGALSSWTYWCTMDLFARQNVRMYFVRWDDENAHVNKEQDYLDLIVEFKGIARDFGFSSGNFFINSNILVNATRHSAHLSTETPLVRIAGINNDTTTDSEHFMHLLKPADTQIYASLPLQIRNVSTDRFNHAVLLKLISNLVNKYHTDFYAFMDLGIVKGDMTIHKLNEILKELQSNSQSKNQGSAVGTYVMLNHQFYTQLTQSVSLKVEYLTTNGAAVNKVLQSEDNVITCDNVKIKAIAPPVPGADAIRSTEVEAMMTKYLLVTGDRLVTPMDIKLFCMTELMSRYLIAREMVSSIRIGRENIDRGTFHTYCTTVRITLTGNKYIHRTFENKIPMVEIYLQKMIENRSTNTFPVRVEICIKDRENENWNKDF